jgi:hypothetical protein
VIPAPLEVSAGLPLRYVACEVNSQRLCGHCGAVLAMWLVCLGLGPVRLLCLANLVALAIGAGRCGFALRDRGAAGGFRRVSGRGGLGWVWVRFLESGPQAGESWRYGAT